MRFLLRMLPVGILSFLAITACDPNRISDAPIGQQQPTGGNQPALIRVTPDSATIAVGDVVQMRAKVYDVTGAELPSTSVQWRTSATSKVKVTSDGIVEGLATGSDTISAVVNGTNGVSLLRVREPRVASLVISLNPAVIEVGQSSTASAIAYKSDGSSVGSRVFWRSMNTAVATIDDHGRITGRLPGTTIITGVSEGKTDSEVLTVSAGAPVPTATSVVVSGSGSVLYVGREAQLTAQVKDAAGNNIPNAPVTWSSSNTAVATVSQTGAVIGRAAGVVTIMATSGSLMGELAMTVAQIPVGAIELVLDPTTVERGTESRAHAVVYDIDGNVLTNRIVVFSSSDLSVATVSTNGTITTLGIGSANIVAGSEGRTASATLYVTAPAVAPVASVDVTLSHNARDVGQTAQATALLKDAQGNALSGRAVTWSSSNNSVATVSSSGVVTAVAAGSANIIATSEGKSGSEAISVSVPVIPVATISVSVNPTNVVVGGTAQALAVPRDASGNALTGRSIAWSSSNSSVASIAANGTITGVAAGTVTVTASSEGKTGTAQFVVNAPPAPTPAPVASVTVSLANSTRAVGENTQATATLRDASNNLLTGRAVTWSSTNTAVATVNSNGVVSAVGAGTAGIRATSEGQTGSATFTVTAPSGPTISSIEISPSSVTLQMGEPRAFSALARYSNGSTGSVAITWSETGGSITTGGTYTAGQSTGRYSVTASSAGVSASATVDVIANYPVGYLGLRPQTVSLAPGQTFHFDPHVYAPGGDDRIWTPLVWSATGGSVDATGNYTAGSTGGTFVVRARSTVTTSKTDSAIITISGAVSAPAPVASVAVSLANSTRAPGQTTQATATLRDAQNNVLSGRSISWSSSNTSVATVNSSGLVTAVAAGSASITATSEGRTGSATLTVAVTPVAPVASVTVSLTSSTLFLGLTTQATAILRDASGNVLTGRSVSFSSSNPLLASVSATGLVTALLAGNVSISATSEGITGSAPLSVQQSSGGGATADMPNRPSGLNTVVDFDGNAVGGNIDWIDPLIVLRQDATAPKSPNGVRRYSLIQVSSGQAKSGAVATRSGLNLTEIYVARWLRPSPDLFGTALGSKSLFIKTGSAGSLYINYMNGLDGRGGDVYMRPIGQGICPSNWMDPNRPGPGMRRGQWSLSEVYFRLNDPGVSNGILRVWTNGQLTHEFTNLNCRSSSSVTINEITSDFYQNLYPANPATWWWDMDHWYISGR